MIDPGVCRIETRRFLGIGQECVVDVVCRIKGCLQWLSGASLLARPAPGSFPDSGSRARGWGLGTHGLPQIRARTTGTPLDLNASSLFVFLTAYSVQCFSTHYPGAYEIILY